MLNNINELSRVARVIVPLNIKELVYFMSLCHTLGHGFIVRSVLHKERDRD